MRQPTVAIAVAVICILTVGCGSTTGHAVLPTTTQTMIPRPIVERELAGLLLSPEQVNVAMGATAMTVTNTQTSMSDHSATMEPQECLAIDGAGGSGLCQQRLLGRARSDLNDGDNFAHYAKQAVVLFPTMEMAGALFETLAKEWPVCRQYSHTQSGSKWSVGPISNANGTLSTVATQQNAKAPGWAVDGRWRLRNNVIVDVNTCSANPADTAVKIADHIGANVAARW